MDPTIRRYILRILLLHVAFLAAVAVVIALAGVALYSSARADAKSAALERVAVPANQTKDLLESHFQRIFGVLRLADRPVPPEEAFPPVLAQDASARQLWFQLRPYVSAVLEIDPVDLRLVDYRSNAQQPEDAADHSLLLVPGTLRSGLRNRELAQQLVDDAAPWLREVLDQAEPAVSGVVWMPGLGDSGNRTQTPVVLAAIALTGAPEAEDPAQAAAGASGRGTAATRASSPPARSLLVGVVPVSYLEDEFLFPASQVERNGLLLFDSTGHLVAGGGESLAGRSVEELVPDHLPETLGTFIRNTVTGQTSDVRREFEGRVRLGTIQFDASLSTARPVRAGGRPLPAEQLEEDPAEPDGEPSEGLATQEMQTASGMRQPVGVPVAGRGPSAPMWLFILVNRQAAVAPLEQTLGTAILWATAMVVAISAILFSSAIQLIRGRSRLERFRTEMIDRELREARQIQLMWLPEDAVRQTPTRQFEIAAENVPASHISGDFYNYFDLDDGRTALVIGDVTGHGLTAAFLMATTQLLVRATLKRLGDPGRTLEEVNNHLCSQQYHGQFVTIQILVIDPRRRQLHASSAGHPPPLTCGPDGRWTTLDLEPQLVLGVLEDSEYPSQTFPLQGSETLLLYTDGVIEVKNDQDQRFSAEMLISEMNRRMGGRFGSAKLLVEQTFAIVRDFSGGTPQDDDLTLLAVHVSARAEGDLNSTDGEPGASARGTRMDAERAAAGSG